MTTDAAPFDEAVALETDGAELVGRVHEGWDIYGIPHGGYLLALAGNAVLTATGAPDVFTITTHYLRKARFGPIRFSVGRLGGSRRFSTVTATATQGEDVVLAVMASVGDRTSFEGPTWHRTQPWDAASARFAPVHATPEQEAAGLRTPGASARSGTRMDLASTGFLEGAPDGTAEIRAVADDLPADQLGALAMCDMTPPAAWNALGRSGWVPTVELTAHVRARAGVGPLAVVAGTRHVEGGFLDEDALVHDAQGRLMVQSRQLARWSS
ncbi:thioesterase family protein [Phycicoccus sp. CSK15P-2]|uniref:thioesterase family protein n=1 Tax=Phycicoccus sp. CSK15P-2 TaxID=2807627 RepID=UPI0019502A5C|nr:thioesterase family protein [Phycicoccus sp. CSK15P-2]MBM6405152.1 thioesterase family protein [Phycicoccus sp. CSK15P-2]